MKKCLVVLFWLFSFSLIGNAQDAVINLSSDSELTALFNPAEIRDLEKMVAFVDEFVQNTTHEKDFNKAYHQLFVDWKIDIVNTQYIDPIPEKTKYALLDSINPDLFNSIWEFETNFEMLTYKDTVLSDFSGIKFLKLKPESPFIAYLKIKGNTQAFYYSFCELMEAVGGISASMLMLLLDNQTSFDYNTVLDRLFGVIFILNTEVSMNSKLDVYFGK